MCDAVGQAAALLDRTAGAGGAVPSRDHRAAVRVDADRRELVIAQGEYCRSRRSTPLRLLRLAQWHRAAIEGAELLEVALAGFRLPLHRRVRMLARAALVVSGAIAARCGRSPGLIYTRRDDEALLTFDGGPRWPSAADGATALLLRTTPDLPAHLVSLARPGGGGADPIAPPVAPAPARSDRPALLPGRLTRAEAPDRHQTEYAKLGCGAHHAFPQARGSSSFHSAIRG